MATKQPKNQVTATLTVTGGSLVIALRPTGDVFKAPCLITAVESVTASGETATQDDGLTVSTTLLLPFTATLAAARVNPGDELQVGGTLALLNRLDPDYAGVALRLQNENLRRVSHLSGRWQRRHGFAPGLDALDAQLAAGRLPFADYQKRAAAWVADPAAADFVALQAAQRAVMARQHRRLAPHARLLSAIWDPVLLTPPASTSAAPPLRIDRERLTDPTYLERLFGAWLRNAEDAQP
ncbi:hypothetical protein [Lacticaseibacillus parakribbianus]|uniref:hypothetical protein n=1 Tax=Lacticaseibacillus parakribbianus TaxID=2970927 RepID=UPI0021CB597E|nr:hypothetical protein [Lacticaseibacillus parakribbianus]